MVLYIFSPKGINFTPKLKRLDVNTEIKPFESELKEFDDFLFDDALLKPFLFFGIYCLKITLPWNFTITSSTAKFSEEL
jgi:hypothetical protein